MTLSDNQMARLPKYARDRIERLEHELADREQKLLDPMRGGSATAFLRDLRSEPGSGPTWDYVPLRDDRIVFKVGRSEFEVYVNRIHRVPVLEVRVSGRHSERIDVMPLASNSVVLRGRTYFEDSRCEERLACALGQAHDGHCRNSHGDVDE